MELGEATREAAVPVDPATAQPAGPEAAVARKPWGKWAGFIDYDPEKGTRDIDFQTDSGEYVKRYWARDAITPIDKDGKSQEAVKPDFYGVVQEPVFQGRRFLRWKTRALGSMTEARDWFGNSEAGRRKQFIEQFGLSFFDSDAPLSVPTGVGGPDATQLWNRGEFLPLMFGPFYKQLYWYDYLLMHTRAFQLVNHSALAAAAVKIMTRFTLGRGVSFHIKDDQARKVWNEFWQRNNMRDKLRTIAHDFTWQGEMMLRYYEPKAGYMTLRVLDASSCWEVVTDPEDVEEVYYYHFQWPTPYQIWVSGNIPVSKYIVQQVPPTNVAHFKMNVSAQERRGRSDLMPGMSWLKRHTDFYNGQTVKSVLEANLVWKIKVKGDQADVDAFLTNSEFTTLPPPGGMWLENDAVNLDVVSATLTSARGSSGIGQQLAALFAVSLNLPNEYFNVEGGAGGARATALVRTDPAVKAIEDRQQRLREIVEDSYDRVMTAALIAGRITRKAAREEPDTQPGGEDEGQPSHLVVPPGPVRARVSVPSRLRALPAGPVRARFAPEPVGAYLPTQSRLVRLG